MLIGRPPCVAGRSSNVNAICSERPGERGLIADEAWLAAQQREELLPRLLDAGLALGFAYVDLPRGDGDAQVSYAGPVAWRIGRS